MRRDSERGAALLTVLLILSLSVAMLGGFMTMVVTDQRLRTGDRDSTRAFYGAHGALEKLTADLGNLFLTDFSPSAGQINALTTAPPVLSRLTFDDDGDGRSGYRIDVQDLNGDGNPFNANGFPDTEEDEIESGPFQGLRALSSTYLLTAVAHTDNGVALGGEVHLERRVNTVSIPLFQFGMFSETDLSVFAGPPFDFGGRVHTNGNFFAAAGTGPLTLRDRVTVVGDVVRTHLSNGWNTNTNYTGPVSVIRSTNTFRNLARNEGSLVGTVGSAHNEPTWTNISIGTYNGYIRNSRTGARRLDLPFVSLGATAIDLIRRGVPGEDSRVLSQRYYSLASLRILLSDANADITALPEIVTATAPLSLNAGAVYAGVPIAQSPGPNPAAAFTTAAAQVNCNVGTITVPNGGTTNFRSVGQLRISRNAGNTSWSTAITYTGKTATSFTGVAGVTTNCPFTNGRRIESVGVDPYATPAGTALLGGVIKIEMQRGNGTWSDVTAEILALGIAGRNIATAGCAVEPSLNAIIRLQRLRPAPFVPGAAPGCGNGSTNPFDYVPNVLYDAREGNLRDNVATNDLTLRLGGVVHYIELDVRNLSRWFRGQIGLTGNQAMNLNGYTVYFSDRRTNRNLSNLETGEYGFEDFVNPLSANGTPNQVLDAGEDVNGNGALERYGENARAVANSTGNWTTAARPWTTVSGDEARLNRAVLFRRALKLVNGGLGNIVMPGLTIVAENPIYVQGNYNANAAGFGNGNAAAAVITDALTLLSEAWSDNASLVSPNDHGGRYASATWYRMAVLAGKGRPFPQPSGTAQDYGTDGGAHNFLRYIENWGGVNLRFRGAIASFFYNRQAVGTFKCCTNVYGAPNRFYDFDLNFRTPSLLPPQTPMFRDVNTTAFRQVIRRGED